MSKASPQQKQPGALTYFCLSDEHLAIRTKPSQASQNAQTKAENLVNPPKLDGIKNIAEWAIHCHPLTFVEKKDKSKFLLCAYHSIVSSICLAPQLIENKQTKNPISLNFPKPLAPFNKKK